MYHHTQKFIDKKINVLNAKEKKCIKCGKIKPISEFTTDNGKRADGHYPRCKECERILHRKMYEENPDRFKLTAKKYARKNPEKQKAWKKISYAIQCGKIIKPNKCSQCHKEVKNSIQLTAHHWHGYDSSHWLDIQWLCRSCHNALSIH